MLNYFFLFNINIINNNFLLTKSIFNFKICKYSFYKNLNLIKIRKNIRVNDYLLLDNNFSYNNIFFKVLSFMYLNNLNTQLFIFNYNSFCNKILYNFNYINILYYLYFFKNISISYNYFFFLKTKKKIIIGIDIKPVMVKFIVKLNLVFLDLNWFSKGTFSLFFLINYYFFFKKNIYFLSSFYRVF